jgi:hypothetical protein
MKLDEVADDEGSNIIGLLECFGEVDFDRQCEKTL